MRDLDQPITLERALALERAEMIALYKAHVNPDLCSLLGLIGFDRRFILAEGVEVTDDQGRVYLDFLGGYGALSLGHNHPEVIAAVESVSHVPNLLQASLGSLVAPLATSIATVAPGDLNKCFFCNSGAEAVEGALKLARISTGRQDFIYAEDSFHGKSMGALSVTGRDKYRQPFEPLVPGCHGVPFGDTDALAAVLSEHECAAFIVEPIQGEGGIIVPPDGYMKAAEELCHAHGALLITDEIQTGFGRTGTLFAVEHDGARPDIMAISKSLGGGIMPIGAYVATDVVWEAGYGDRDRCVLHTSTFGGNTRACAAALKTIEIIMRDDLAGAARRKGEMFKRELESIGERYGLVKEVRGRGLMLGVEFYEPKIAKNLSHEYLAASVAGLLLQDHGIITAYTLNNPNVIRFEPPLTVTDEQIGRALEAFDDTLKHHKSLVGVVAGLGRTLLQRGRS
ncbi:MAG: putrescine aminotransferase [Actinobacteria bacterium HGW-Actinobacteria-6]|nr:MAG: putrescine aminotransferase [Actinobacteria bacterium HGW-Actinobacteria-6]